LKEIIVNGAPARVKSKVKSRFSKQKVIYWKHYNKKQHRFNVVRSERGGGLKKLKFKLNDTKKELLASCIRHFWNNKKKLEDNKMTDDFQFFLTDGREEMINDTLEIGNETVPFTVAKYVEACKLTRVRLFFCSKEKNILDQLTNRLVASSSDEEWEGISNNDNESIRVNESLETQHSFSNFSSLPHTSTPTSDRPSRHIPDSDHTSTRPPDSDATSTLLGASADRSTLVAEQDREYQQSLQIDQQKETKTKNEQRLANLIADRKRKVPVEPSLEEDHVIIRIRHPILG